MSIIAKLVICLVALNYFLVEDPTSARFCLLPKIHKRLLARADQYRADQLFQTAAFTLRIYLHFWTTICNHLLRGLNLIFTLKGLNFAGIKFRGWLHPRNLDFSRGFNFADPLFSNISRMGPFKKNVRSNLVIFRPPPPSPCTLSNDVIKSMTYAFALTPFESKYFLNGPDVNTTCESIFPLLKCSKLSAYFLFASYGKILSKKDRDFII